MLSIPSAHRYYLMQTEIENYSYAALRDNVERYPQDEILRKQIVEALIDGEIVGAEHKGMLDRLLDINHIYHGAKIDADHSNAKIELIAMIGN